MNEEERVGKEVARLLNHSIGEINQDTLYRLKAARRAAMENYQLEEKIIHAGAGMAGQNGLDSFSLIRVNSCCLSWCYLF